MDRRIKIRHLQALTEIVRAGSLKRAAERLLLTQPAISRTLAELERIVGAELLVRDRGGVRLTPQGAFFHGRAQASLAALQDGLDGLSPEGGARRMRLRVGALPTVAAGLLPEVVRDLLARAPDLRLTIADGAHAHLTGLLRTGDLDVVAGLMGSPDSMDGLSFTQLYQEEVAVITRPGHPLLATPDLHRVSDWPVVFPAPWAAIRPLVERLFIAAGAALPERRIDTVSGAFGRVHVRQSDAVWFISAGVVAREVAEGTLARVGIDTALTRGTVGLMRRDGAPDDPAVALFRDCLARAIGRVAVPPQVERG